MVPGSSPGEPTIIYILISFNSFKNFTKNTVNAVFVMLCLFKWLSMILNRFNCF
nr:MAG TPA: hypothetical protein [Caudoviricetes sp.]